MYCHNCGQLLADETKKCPICGADIPAPEEAANAADGAQNANAGGSQNVSGGQYGGYNSSPYGQYNGSAYGQQGGYPQGRPAAAPEEKDPKEAWAIAGLVVSILGAFSCCCIPFVIIVLEIMGVVFSAIGLKSKKSHTLAVVALVISIVFLIVGILESIGVYYLIKTGMGPLPVEDFEFPFPGMESFDSFFSTFSSL